MPILYKGKLYEEGEGPVGSFGPNTSSDIAMMPANLGLYSRFGYSGKKVNIYPPKKKRKKKYSEAISTSINEVMTDLNDRYTTKREIKDSGNLATGHAGNFIGGPTSNEMAKSGLDLLRTINKYRKGKV